MIVVTGSSGFVGRALVASLRQGGGQVRPVVRIATEDETCVAVGDLLDPIDWGPAVSGASSVIHLAGLAHIESDPGLERDDAYRKVNAVATELLATAAAQAGIRRMVLLSTIGVNGAFSGASAFQASDEASPSNPYARSKLAAEIHLQQIAERYGMEWVVVRAPLIYGPDAPGNFSKLQRLVLTGLPLPLGAATARRSFVGLDNVVSLLKTVESHPAAANKVFLVRDHEEPSVAELLVLIGEIRGRSPSRVFTVPQPLVRLALGVLGRSKDAERLFAPLRIDISDTITTLGWTPPVTLRDGLARALQSKPASGLLDARLNHEQPVLMPVPRS